MCTVCLVGMYGNQAFFIRGSNLMVLAQEKMQCKYTITDNFHSDGKGICGRGGGGIGVGNGDKFANHNHLTPFMPS